MSFPVSLVLGLFSSLAHRYGCENWDYDRFGDKVDYDHEPGIRWLLYVLKHIREFAAFYNLMDGESRSLMVQLILYRILGYKKVKLSTNTPDYWGKRQAVNQLMVSAGDKMNSVSGGWELPLFELDSIGYSMKINTTFIGIQTIYMLRHYEYKSSLEVVGVQPGDYVIDAGGCWGDTALFFAHEIGPEGKVFSFEFVKDNIDIFRRNLEMNLDLGQRIEIVPHPLFSRSDLPLYYKSRGPSTNVTDTRINESDVEVRTLSIDDFIHRNEIPRVDFIKMDVEGAELAALKGAENTIRKYRPKLAISLYHKKSDFVEIPSYLTSLSVDYHLCLGHYTIHSEETVLFAK